MLELKITNKQDLIRLIQSSNIKKIKAVDIHNKDDIAKLSREADQLIRTNQTITMFIVTT